MPEPTANAAIPQKELFRIGEVSRLTALKAFVLRYWETEFPMLQPVKAPSGHRLYRREDVETVLKIKRLLYEEGFTIAGARKHLAEGSPSTSPGAGGNGRATSLGADVALRHPRGSAAQRKRLLELRDELRAILTLLQRE